MQKILKNIYLVSAGIFLIISLLGAVIGKSLPSFIAGATIALLCVAFSFVFKPKWSEESKKTILDSFEGMKSLGEQLPLAVIGKLQMVFIIIMFVCLFKSVVSLLLPAFPSWILVIIKNVSFSLYLLGTFYALLSGNLSALVKTTKLFAYYEIIEVIFAFVTESFKINTSAMCLFLAFYSLSYLISYMTSETDPALEVEEEKKPKKEKVKKDKKDKKNKSEKAESEVTEATEEAEAVEEKTE